MMFFTPCSDMVLTDNTLDLARDTEAAVIAHMKESWERALLEEEPRIKDDDSRKLLNRKEYVPILGTH